METTARKPSLGIIKERKRIRRRLGPPYGYAAGLLGSVAAFFAMLWLLHLKLFPESGKAALAWLVVPGIGVWCLTAILWWPFSRPSLKKRLIELERVDRLSELKSMQTRPTRARDEPPANVRPPFNS